MLDRRHDFAAQQNLTPGNVRPTFDVYFTESKDVVIAFQLRGEVLFEQPAASLRGPLDCITGFFFHESPLTGALCQLF